MKKKPDYLLIERGRYYYQRKVPLELQPAVGQRKWRAPLGKDFEEACDKLRTLKPENDILITSLVDPTARQDHKTRTRRTRELRRAEADAAADASYEEWCRQNGEPTEAEEFERDFPDFDPNDAWREADIWLAALEEERERRLHEYLEITPAGTKKFIPEPMDDDEYHDRLVECYKGHFWRPNHSAEISRRP